MPQRPMSVNPSGTILSLHLRSSSVSSSLASPGDSGVAFDSDMELANETDASSYKEVYFCSEVYAQKYKSLSFYTYNPVHTFRKIFI